MRGQDRHRLALHEAGGHGVCAHELHRCRVHHLGRLDVGDVGGVLRHVVLDHVVVGEGHVGRRERLAVLPLHAAPQVDRPDLAIGRDAAVLLGRELAREVERRRVVLAGCEEVVVVQRPDLPALRHVADERVEVVGLGGPAEVQGERAGRRRRRRRWAGGQRGGHAPGDARGQHDHYGQKRQPAAPATSAPAARRELSARHCSPLGSALIVRDIAGRLLQPESALTPC